MPLSRSRSFIFAAAVAVAASAISIVPGAAQSGEPKSSDQKPAEQKPAEQSPAANAPAGEPGKAEPGRTERNIRADQTAEAGRALKGPAANAECVWLGERAVGLLWRDDLDTAFRHLDLYDRFGCPGGHVQTTFRCVVRQGNIDPKSTETLTARVHACWLDPDFVANAALPAGANTQAAPEKGAGTNPRQ
jgi:hypothetical protein